MSEHHRIFIIDSDADRQDLPDMITSLGCEVAGLALDGAQGVEMALRLQPDIILINVNLPGAMSGAQAAEEIRARLDVPVVFLVPCEGSLPAPEGEDPPASLVKPPDRQALCAVLTLSMYRHASERRTTQLNQDLRALREVNRLVAREHNPQRLLDEACAILLNSRGLRFVWIDRPEGLSAAASAGEGLDLLHELLACATPEQHEKLPARRAALQRTPVLCADILQDEIYAPWWQKLADARVLSAAAVPILHRDELFGVLIAYASRINFFSVDEVALLEDLASNIAFGLKSIREETERRRAEEDTRQRNAELTVLNQIGQRLNRLAKPSDILEMVFVEIGKVLDNRNVFITLYDKAQQYISFEVYTQNGVRHVGVGRPLSNGITDYIIRNNQPFLVKENIDEARRTHGIVLRGTPSRSFLGVPMHIGGEVIGVIALQDYDDENVYNEHHLELLTTIAAQAASALENARLYGEVQQELEERKQAEQAVRRSEALFRAVVEHSHDGILFVDRERRLLYVSPSYQRIDGNDPQALVGTNREEFIHPEDRPTAALKFADLLERPGDMLNGEYRVMHKDGNWRWVETNATNLLNEPDVQAVIITSRNIHERKQAEERLHAAKSMLEAIIGVSPLAMFLLDVEGNIQIWNHAAEKIFGWQAEEVLGKLNPIVAQEQRDEYQHLSEQVLSGESISNREIVRKRKDGTLRTLSLSSAPVYDPAGNLAGRMAIMADITEKKLAELALRESEVRYRAISEDSMIGVYMIQEGRLVYVNHTLAATFGFEPHELLGLSPLALTHPDDHDLVTENVRRRVSGEVASLQYEFRGLCKNGEVRSVQVLGTRVDLNGIPTVIGNLLDITERKQAEQAITQHSAELRTLNQIGQALSRLAEPAEIMNMVYNKIGEILDNSNLYIALYDHEKRYISFPIYTMRGVRVDGGGRDLGRGITDYIIRNNVPLLIKGSESDALNVLDIDMIGTPSVSFLAVPMRADNKVLGVIAVQDYERENVFDEHHEDMLLTIAAQTAIALENARLYHATQRELEERKRAEEALEKSERNYRLLFENAPVGILVIDRQGQILEINPRGLTIIGSPSQEITKQINFLKFPPLVQVGASAAAERCLATGEITNTEVYYTTLWGKSIYLQYQMTPIYDEHGQVQWAQLILEDISDRKLAEEAQRESEEKFATAFQDAPVLISISDMETGQYIDVNEESLRSSGYTREEVIGSTAINLNWISPESRLRLMRELRTKGMINNLEMTFRKKDGSEMIGLVKGEIITLAGRDCLLTVTVDITEQKQAQTALDESREQLQAVVQTASDAIITMNPRQEIAFWNDAAESMFGFTSSEMIGKSISQIVPTQFHARSEQAARVALTGNVMNLKGRTLETIGKHKSGWEFPVEISFAGWEVHGDRFVTAILRDITERKQHEREMQAITSLSAALRTAPSTAEMLPVLIDQTASLMNVQSVQVELIDPETGETVVRAAHGLRQALVGTRQKAGTGLNAIIAKTGQPFVSQDLGNEPLSTYPSWAREEIRGGAGLPLIAQENLIGFLWIGRKGPLSNSEVQLFSAIGDIAANAIHRATLHDEAVKSADNLVVAYDSTLLGLARALELRDRETEGHSQRVVGLTLRLAEHFNVPEADLRHIRHGAILHDVGKMGVPDSILHKPGALTDAEWEIMRQHPLNAHRLLWPIEHLRPALDIPYCHHEKWDGSGYPRGLKGAEIPLPARLFAVVDVWDALRSDRPYRPAWDEEKVLEHIRAEAGTHFDPQVVEGFMKLIDARQV